MLTRERLGALVSVLLGVAVVTVSLLLLGSHVPRVPERFVAAGVVVRSPAPDDVASTFPQTRPWSPEETSALVNRLAAVSGVVTAVPDRDFYGQPVIAGRPVPDQVRGQGWAGAALAGHRLTAGSPPVGERDVVVGRALGVPVGGRLTVLTAAGPASWTVSGLVDPPALYVADPTAARLAPGVRAIGLLGRPDIGAVTAAVGTAGTVLTGPARGALEPRADARTRWIGLQVLTAMAALSAFAGVFVVASTFAFVVNQRRRQFGLLRAVGATPRQVRRLVHREALAVGAAASAAGVLLGALAAVPLARVLVDAGLEPAGFTVRWQVWPPLAAFAAGPVVALLGSAVAARRAGRIPPLAALREAAVETRPMTRARWATGLAVAAAAGAAGLATATTDDVRGMATTSLLGAMALIVAATLLGPAVLPALVRALLWPLRGVTGTLVRENALTAVRRTASTAAPVLLTVSFAVFITGNVQTTAGAYAAARDAAVRAPAVLVPDGTPGLADAAVTGTGGAALLPTEVHVDRVAVPAVGLEPAAYRAAVRDPGTAAGSPAALAGDTVALSRSTAQRFGWRPGGVAPVTFADGRRVALRVVAVLEDGAPAGLVLPRDTVRAHDPSALTSAVFLPERPAGASAIGARVVDAASWARQADAEEDRLVWIFTVLLVGVSAGYGAVAVAGTLLMATARRAADLRQLRLVGATRRQVLLTVATESVLVVAVGALLGGVVAWLALQGSMGALREQAGAPVALVVPWPVVSAVVAACLLLALAATVLPARSLAR
ncbi:ABC transporter permease [Micromonospora sp. PLK6-60]|uniref:ABC transporter permease n=1 Tax=Micromonospora sp. PLK6-60 TaxID=2873383 RepID=UPI001CA716FE|nr:ABC transporter permease [Micromonospora sp. PLK6-60]MBY8871763.1 ABC transporter permease [Micromonospora sp. PLK6-60]